MFLYDTHVHSSECSACGRSTAREMVRAYKDAGYSGFALTNHFYHGNTSIDRHSEWADFVRPYFEAFKEAWDEGQKLDFDVIFGIEEGVGRGKELLIYNIDYDFLADLPDLRHAEKDALIDAVHSVGGFVVHAHPYRYRDYMKEFFEPDFTGCDGIEVFNACNKPEENERAAQAASRLGLITTAGEDNHYAGSTPDSGVLFARRVKTAAEFVKELCSPDTRLMCDGKELER